MCCRTSVPGGKGPRKPILLRRHREFGVNGWKARLGPSFVPAFLQIPTAAGSDSIGTRSMLSHAEINEAVPTMSTGWQQLGNRLSHAEP